MSKPNTTRRIGRPKGADGRQTKIRIVQAAQAEFGKRGFMAATNASIARSADLSAGAIYKHFSSKTEVYLEAFFSAQQDLLLRFAQSAANSQTVSEALTAVYKAAGQFMLDEPDTVSFLLGVIVDVHRHQDLADAIRGDERGMNLQFERWFEASGYRFDASGPMAAHNVVGVFLGSMMGLGVMALVQDTLDINELMEAFLQLGPQVDQLEQLRRAK